MHQLLQEMKPFMTHSFLNVRERLGSMLTNIFISDLDFSKFPGKQVLIYQSFFKDLRVISNEIETLFLQLTNQFLHQKQF